MSAYFDRIARGLCGISGCEEKIAKGQKICRTHKAIMAERTAASRANKTAAGTCMRSGCPNVPKKGVYCDDCKTKNDTERRQRTERNRASGLCINAKSHGPAKEGCALCQKCIDQLSTTSIKHYHRRKEAGLCYYCNNPPEPGKTTCPHHTAVAKDARFQLKVDALNAYGGAQCSWPDGCDCHDPDVLQLDHIDGKGNEHRREIGVTGGIQFFQWLKSNGYPQEPALRVLCPTHNTEAYAASRR